MNGVGGENESSVSMFESNVVPERGRESGHIRLELKQGKPVSLGRVHQEVVVVVAAAVVVGT